ncbi:MAG: hypothetical protein JWM82_2360, partial [Myxococcales bacterium]|nr:hypothetical protein [Myxococcales bacterium]
VAPALVTVEIAAAPPALHVQLDGHDVASPIKMARDGRPHQLSFAAPGYLSKQQTIAATKDLVVAPDLQQAVAAPRPASARAHHPKGGSHNVVTDL